jgi:hypothetical protein
MEDGRSGAEMNTGKNRRKIKKHGRFNHWPSVSQPPVVFMK